MIYIALPFPILPRTTLETVAYNLDEPLEEIKQVYGYAKYVDPEMRSGLKYLTEMELHDNDLKLDHTYMGTQGLLKLAEKKGRYIDVVRQIYIPAYVWEVFKAPYKSDIAYLMGRIEDRIKRYNRLEEMGAPEIIVRNESRLLEEGLSSLVDNSEECGYNRVRNRNAQYCYSLKDAKYSLLTYTWEDPRAEETGFPEDKIDEITVPKYLSHWEVNNIEKENEKLKVENEALQVHIEVYEQQIADLTRILKSQEEKYKQLKEERETTVKKLNKEILHLDHRLKEATEMWRVNCHNQVNMKTDNTTPCNYNSSNEIPKYDTRSTTG